jgi:hypothetical protein
MANKESGKALAEALKHNSVLTALDVSNNTRYTHLLDGPGFAQELAIGIKDNGALSCEDGRCYHEWQLNPRFGARKQCQSCRGNLQELSLAEVALKYGASEDKVLEGMGCDICSTAMNSRNKWPVHHCASEDCDWDMCNECFDTPEYKYISTDPGIKGQEEDPGVQFDNVVCLHCNKPKDQHSNKGAMTSLNLASNNLRAEGAKVVAEAIKVTKCTPAIILVSFSRPSGFSISCCCLLLSAGYEGPIRRKCHGQPHWQGAVRQAPEDNALQAQPCFSLRYRR